MDQMSMFSSNAIFPCSYEDIENIYREYIFEGETDKDVFTSKKLKKGSSYFFYGKRVFIFVPPSEGKPKLTIFRSDKTSYDLTSTSDPKEITAAYNELKKMKKEIFDNLNSEPFGCCNDFVRCSDALKCLHSDDRFYNNCYYRKNLEAGKVFYGKNKNI